MVDLPAPERPVNHSTAGFWFFWLARMRAVTRVGCQTISVLARCDAVGAMTMPAPTVPKCSRSTMMKEPVWRDCL
jgi:hypothetical protein